VKDLLGCHPLAWCRKGGFALTCFFSHFFEKKIRYQFGLITDFVDSLEHYVIIRPGRLSRTTERRRSNRDTLIPAAVIMAIMLF
jgi:hypothetical protein